MVPLSSFRRGLGADGREVEVDIPAWVALWLSDRQHYGGHI